MHICFWINFFYDILQNIPQKTAYYISEFFGNDLDKYHMMLSVLVFESPEIC